MKNKSKLLIASALIAAVFEFCVPAAQAQSCDMAAYKAAPGLTATADGSALVVTWDGDKGSSVRMRLAIDNGTPTVQDLSVRQKGGAWASLGSNVTPEFRVVSGIRRVSQQQLNSLREIGENLTPAVWDREKWDAFWDAPLSGKDAADRDAPADRKAEDIKRATATYHAQSCKVATNGTRIEIEFPGLEMGIFSGSLKYTVYKGTNLIRMEAIAKTEEQSVAYKYDAGFKGLPIKDVTRVFYRDTANNWEKLGLVGMNNEHEVPLRSANRLVIAEGPGGSIAAFPPPHIFFWARESDDNLGYSWYRKDSDSSFSFGVRQAEHEDLKEYAGNFALYSAPPGTWQHMAMYFYPSADNAKDTAESALAFTHGDRYKPLPGYQTMAHHYHTQVAQRMMAAHDMDLRLPDFDTMKDVGIDIASPADFHGGECHPWDPGPARFACQKVYYDAVKKFSDQGFLIEPDEEMDCNHWSQDGSPSPRFEKECPAGAYLGGHWDVIYSHPVYWTRVRAAGQPFMEQDPTYGKVYHVGSAADVIELMRRENLLIYQPHPRTKESTGFPDAIKDKDYFTDERYRGIGWRWGMGLDLSEKRMSEKRGTALFDDMNNWVADRPTPPKYILAISETRFKTPGLEDLYGMAPINYVKIDKLPRPDDMSSIVNALRHGNYFVSTGEVLIPNYAVEGTGNKRTITADLDWTFPLEYAEVVWGDGQKTDRQIIPLTDLPAFGKHHFAIPFDATGKKWVRFAVWDSAGNGAMVMPIKLPSATQPAAGNE